MTSRTRLLSAADQVGSRLAQLGFAVSEVKLRSTVAINERGEFMLSRDIRALGASQNAQALVAGTYAAGNQAVYVSLRLISLSDSRILGGVDYALPAGPNTPEPSQVGCRRLVG
jgi:hypothetical protein